MDNKKKTTEKTQPLAENDLEKVSGGGRVTQSADDKKATDQSPNQQNAPTLTDRK